MSASRRLKKGDLWLIGGVLLAAAVLFAWSALRPASPGAQVRVTVDEQTYAVCPLDTDTELNIVTPYGQNRLVIQNGTAFIETADCPQQICVHHRAISKTGEVIVCLPHRVVVTVEHGDAPDVDAIT